jgi:hypothetical protein
MLRSREERKLVVLSVSDTQGEAGSDVESHVRFEIADCVRNVQLEFPLHDADVRRNSLQKARLFSSALRRLEQALAAEAKVATARERAREALRAHSANAAEWMVPGRGRHASSSMRATRACWSRSAST